MSEKTPSFPFPSEWNRTIERQINEYKTCGIYYDDKDSFIDHYNKNFFFHIICLILLFFTITSCIILLKFRHSYEVNNKHNLSMIMIYIISIILNITTTYLSYPLFFFSILGFILRYIKDCSIKYMKYCYNFDDEKKNKIGLFIKKYYTDERLISLLLLAVIISLVYITILILNGGSFRLFPLEQGFCELK
ncbi:hypothetical protein H8356DRAFT_960601 [Neocallimastix lanati (nom. inval.)]|nr:hypothetical protein H8356DRAFT_960601 [Neocallimastix sp. JGI-2020a]